MKIFMMRYCDCNLWDVPGSSRKCFNVIGHADIGFVISSGNMHDANDWSLVVIGGRVGWTYTVDTVLL